MILSSIHLKNFRKHTNSIFSFSNGLNYIVGGNGLGKTSILESIYYLCTTKSYNTKSDSEAVSFNESEFEIKGSFRDLTNNDIRIFYSAADNRKYYYLNNKHIYRSSEIIGKFPVVMLAPADHSITQGAPAERRKFIDSVISQASATYLNFLLDYNRTLRHRSSLLSYIKENRNKSNFDELDAWTLKLISSGAEIIKHRIKFIEEFNSFIKNSYKVIMGDDETPQIIYTTSDFNFEDNDSTRQIEIQFKDILNEKRDEELRRGNNLAGPHRDDYIFEINNLNLKAYGSQGQHKTFQAVLRFAEFFYLKEITGKTPIFLLDDVFGELDINRSFKISSYLKEVGQAFITLTDFTNLSFLPAGQAGLKRSDNDFILKLNGEENIPKMTPLEGAHYG